MESLKLQYRNLEMRVMRSLRDLIEKSKTKSKVGYDVKVIKVNVFGFVELAIIDDQLIFLDSDGNQYTIFCDVTLEDLIDLLEKHN